MVRYLVRKESYTQKCGDIAYRFIYQEANFFFIIIVFQQVLHLKLHIKKRWQKVITRYSKPRFHIIVCFHSFCRQTIRYSKGGKVINLDVIDKKMEKKKLLNIFTIIFQVLVNFSMS